MDDTLLKLASDSILLVFLFGAMYFLRPVLKEFLQQQIEQLKRIAEQQATSNEIVRQLADAQRIFADRLEHVEDLLGVVAASRAPSAAMQPQPARRTSARKRGDEEER